MCIKKIIQIVRHTNFCIQLTLVLNTVQQVTEQLKMHQVFILVVLIFMYNFTVMLDFYTILRHIE